MVSSPEKKTTTTTKNERTSQIKKHYVYMHGLNDNRMKRNKIGFTRA
jgi:hypothetical protein